MATLAANYQGIKSRARRAWYGNRTVDGSGNDIFAGSVLMEDTADPFLVANAGAAKGCGGIALEEVSTADVPIEVLEEGEFDDIPVTGGTPKPGSKVYLDSTDNFWTDLTATGGSGMEVGHIIKPFGSNWTVKFEIVPI